MIELLQAAVAQALAEHDNQHQNHLTSKDTYGWALYHNGRLVEIEVDGKRGVTGHIRTKFLTKLIQFYDYETESGYTLSEGNTYRLLRGVTPNSDGWYGIVMAGMTAGKLYFSLDYEADVLQRTVYITRSEIFPSVFKN